MLGGTFLQEVITDAGAANEKAAPELLHVRVLADDAAVRLRRLELHDFSAAGRS